MIHIEVYGPGCARCEAAKQAIRQAAQTAGVETTLVHIHDPREMAKHRVFFTPAIRIDGEMKCAGRVPKVEEIREWLTERTVA